MEPKSENTEATRSSRLCFPKVAAIAIVILSFTDARAVQASETVILLHGLGRTKASMAVLADRVSKAGFDVVNVSYDSTGQTFDELVETLGETVDACCRDHRRDVHFVTHSLGGILVRKYLADHSPSHRGRVVMLSPPNRGSEIVDAFGDLAIFEGILGETATDLGTNPESVPASLGPAHFEVGIITGDRSFNPIFSWLIPGPDDGKVSVENAKLEGAADFLVVPRTHTFIMNSSVVAEQTIHFLQHGRFHSE